ncbi:MAG TPA: response regulator transcription factor [Opitutaceae bacterium]|nr:response regulator transcription factor [Opitutaceae bacterium]
MPPPDISQFSPASRPPTGKSPDQIRRVVVAQWGRTYAEALTAVCRRAFPLAEISPCCSGAETLAALRKEPADVLLIALTFPDTDGVDLLPLIARENLATRVLVASHRREEHSLQALRAARFDGLIDTLEESVETLISALHLVANGEPYISPTLRGAVIDRPVPGIVMQKLTPMETRVLAELGDGSNNPAVASRLGLSAATVQTHRRNLMHKLGLHNGGQLVCAAIRLGLVRITPDGRAIRPGFAMLSAQRRRTSSPAAAYPARGNQQRSRRSA